MNRVDAVEFLDANKAEEAIRSAVNAGAITYYGEHPIVDVSTRQLPRIERALLRRSCERPPAASGGVVDASGRLRSSAIDREAFAFA